MPILDPLVLPYTSPRGSRATQTSTSTSVCSTPLSEVEIGRSDLATEKAPHHETSCSQLDREPNHAAQQSQPAPSDEMCPAAGHLQTQSLDTVTCMRS